MSKRAANEPTSPRERFDSLLSQIKELYKETSDRCDDEDRNDELWEKNRLARDKPITGPRKKASIEEHQKRSEEQAEIYKRHESSLRKFKAFLPVVRKCLSDLQFHLGTEESVSLLQRFKEASPPLKQFPDGENISWEDARDYLGEIKALIDEGLALLSGERDEGTAAKPSDESAVESTAVAGKGESSATEQENLSRIELAVYDIVGEDRLRILTNRQVRDSCKKDLLKYKELRIRFGKTPKLNEALRSCFNRIRKKKGLPESSKIKKTSQPYAR